MRSHSLAANANVTVLGSLIPFRGNCRREKSSLTCGWTLADCSRAFELSSWLMLRVSWAPYVLGRGWRTRPAVLPGPVKEDTAIVSKFTLTGVFQRWALPIEIRNPSNSYRNIGLTYLPNFNLLKSIGQKIGNFCFLYIFLQEFFTVLTTFWRISAKTCEFLASLLCCWRPCCC